MANTNTDKTNDKAATSKQVLIESRLEFPIKIGLDKRTEDGRLEAKRFVSIVPSSITIEGHPQGVTPMPDDVWQLLKKDERVRAYIKARQIGVYTPDEELDL